MCGKSPYVMAEKLKTTLAPFISRTHQHIDGYNLDAVLRGGFFKIKAPVFSHPYVVVQTIVVIIITLCVTAGFYTMHESGFMHVDPSIAAKADGMPVPPKGARSPR